MSYPLVAEAARVISVSAVPAALELWRIAPTIRAQRLGEGAMEGRALVMPGLAPLRCRPSPQERMRATLTAPGHSFSPRWAWARARFPLLANIRAEIDALAAQGNGKFGASTASVQFPPTDNTDRHQLYLVCGYAGRIESARTGALGIAGLQRFECGQALVPEVNGRPRRFRNGCRYACGDAAAFEGVPRQRPVEFGHTSSRADRTCRCTPSNRKDARDRPRSMAELPPWFAGSVPAHLMFEVVQRQVRSRATGIAEIPPALPAAFKGRQRLSKA